MENWPDRVVALPPELVARVCIPERRAADGNVGGNVLVAFERFGHQISNWSFDQGFACPGNLLLAENSPEGIEPPQSKPQILLSRTLLVKSRQLATKRRQ